MKSKTNGSPVLALAAFIFLLAANLAFAFYNPQVGRWANRDPIEESGGYNLFTLTLNNPISIVDSYGLQCVTEIPYALFARPPIIPRPLIDSAIEANRGAARIRLPDGRKLDLFDKFGKGHWDKATQQRIPTPHVHEPAPPEYAPRFSEWTRPATLGDILDGIIEAKGSLGGAGCGNCNQNGPPAQVTVPFETPIPVDLKEAPQPTLLPGCVSA